MLSGSIGAAIASACEWKRAKNMIAQRQPALAIESTE
jgi:hypothetical protein